MLKRFKSAASFYLYFVASTLYLAIGDMGS